MQNPSAVGDSSGEWLELHNATGAAIDIDGWTVEDAGSDSHLISNANGTTLIPAGGFLVLGNNADMGTNGGAPVDYQYSGFTLANGDDEVILLDDTLTEIDRVEYDGGPAFPDPNGASMALKDPGLDNNVGTNWCTSSVSTYGDGDFGTPGAANDCPNNGACCQGGICTDDLSPAECEGENGGIFQGSETLCADITCPAPSNAIVRITEFQHGGADEEFIEFTNLDVVAIDMTGWSFDDDSNTPGTVDLSAFGMVAPGESVILTEADAATFDTAWSLGGAVGIIGNLNANLSGGGDTINLYDASATLVDTLTYAGGSADGVTRWPCEEVIGLDQFNGWISSSVGDVQNSITSAGGDIGSPGEFVLDPCRGACCDNGTGTCNDDVELAACAFDFTINTDCIDLDPPCQAPATGACCYAGFCAEGVSNDNCFSGGGEFQGDGTDCSVACPAGPSVSINEIRIDQPGDDNDEYFELCGDADASLDGIWYVVLGDSAVASGSIEAAIPLTGQVIPGDGLFLAAESTFTLGTADLTTTLDFENSDNVTHLLVAGFTGNIGDDLDVDDDCTLDSMPWAGELDRIALVEEENPPTGTECHYGPPSVGPDGPFVPGQIFRCTDCTGDWNIGGFDPIGGNDTPGEPNACVGACCSAGTCTEVTEAECTGEDGGLYQGDLTTCDGITCPDPSGAIVRITEYMYSGTGGEFIEFTNLDANPIDLTGWSYDDSSRTPGTVDLSGFGTVNPGESVILTEDDAATFATDWSLAGIAIVGGLDANIGRNDEINLYDNSGALVDRLTYGDQDFPGTIRTQEISGWPCENAVGLNDIFNWVLSVEADVQNSFLSANGDLGNPGAFVLDPCLPPPTGACCDGGACTEVTEAECTDAGGTYQGDETVCEGDADGDLTDGSCGDDCPNDPDKTSPGACGCGNADTDSDGDNVPDCNDGCPNDPLKTSPGACGCGVSGEADSDGDSVADCNDVCQGLDDTIDENGDGEPDCLASPTVPTVSTWGLVALALLLLVGGKLMVSNRRLAIS